MLKRKSTLTGKQIRSKTSGGSTHGTKGRERADSNELHVEDEKEKKQSNSKGKVDPKEALLAKENAKGKLTHKKTIEFVPWELI